jgi:hypothetical protein
MNWVKLQLPSAKIVNKENQMMKKEKLSNQIVKPAQLAGIITRKGNLFVPFAILASIKMQQELRPAKIAQQEKI